MKIELKEDLPFIHRKGIRFAYLEAQNGAMVLKADGFKQLLKPKEVEEVKRAAGIVIETKSAEKEEPAVIDVGSKVGWINAKEEERTGEVLEFIEAGKRVRVRCDQDDKVFKIPFGALTLLSKA